MQLAFDLPTPKQPKPRPCALRAWAQKRADARNALFWPSDERIALLADHLFDRRGEVSAFNETLRTHPPARAWLRKLIKLGILQESTCPIFHRQRWRAVQFA